MKKHDFKKLALLGMAAGSLVAAQSAVASDATEISGTYLAAHSCGSSGCNSPRSPSTGAGNNQQVADADEDQPTRGGGCNASRGSYGTPTNGQRQAGCNATSNYNNSNSGTTNGQRQAGCSAMRNNSNTNQTSNQGYLACGCEDEENQAST